MKREMSMNLGHLTSGTVGVRAQPSGQASRVLGEAVVPGERLWLGAWRRLEWLTSRMQDFSESRADSTWKAC